MLWFTVRNHRKWKYYKYETQNKGIKTGDRIFNEFKTGDRI